MSSDESDNDLDNFRNNMHMQSIANEEEAEQFLERGSSTISKFNRMQSSAPEEQKPKVFPSLLSNKDYEKQKEEIIKKMKIFTIILLISLGFFVICLSLGIVLWVTKKQLFGIVYTFTSLFTLLVIIFNLIALFFFNKKFSQFESKAKSSNTVMEILEQGDQYEELLTSKESSLMNLGMYLIMFTIIAQLLFAFACIYYHKLIGVIINIDANNLETWKDIYGDSSYDEVYIYLSSFCIIFGILAALGALLCGFLFYLVFSILGFFQIYKKIVQFLSLLYLQIGIVFLYMSFMLNWFRNISIIETNFVHWVPIALMAAGGLSICISIFMYIGSTQKNWYYLIGTNIAFIVFVSGLVAFYIATVLSISSLDKFSDNKCPVFLDYFHSDYIHKQMGCNKYIQVSKPIEELNCPKERIVTYWESIMDKTYIPDSSLNMYGCINISCCFKTYTILKTFGVFVTLICLFLIIFGLGLIGVSSFLIYLIQQNYSLGVEEKGSTYSVSCFVAIITILFIILAIKTKTPKLSPSFSEDFNPSPNDSTEVFFNPMSVIIESPYLFPMFNEEMFDKFLYSKVIETDDKGCSKKGGCEEIEYIITMKSKHNLYYSEEDFKGDGKKYYVINYGQNGKTMNELNIKTNDNLIWQILFNKIYSKNFKEGFTFCPMNAFIVSIDIKFKTRGTILPDPSVVLNEEKPFTVIESEDKKNILYMIHLSNLQQGIIYDLINEDYDLSYGGQGKMQIFEGRVMEINNKNEKVPAFNQKITFTFLNFPQCKSFTVTTDLNGKFSSGEIPRLSKNIQNEIKMDFNGNELSKIIISGGLGAQEKTNLGEIILQKEFKNLNLEEESKNLFNSFVINSEDISPIENALIYLFEGDQYFPNVDNTEDKYDYEIINNEYLYANTKTDKDGYFQIGSILNKEVYTILIVKEGFHSYIRTITKGEKIQSFSITPMENSKEDNSYKVVLEWPNSPSDLNLFSFFETADGDSCEVFFGNKKCRRTQLVNENYNNGTQGAQTIKIEEMGQYDYLFAVSKFNINDDSLKRKEIKVKGGENKAPIPVYPQFMRNKTEETELTELKGSNANLKLYYGEMKRPVYESKINEEHEGKWWMGICIDGRIGIKSLKTINVISDTEPNKNICI
ncbi:MAG: hypothetical protein MJ252_17035 [archaeon]|nr:hypothetical protein [archaeon]